MKGVFNMKGIKHDADRIEFYNDIDLANMKNIVSKIKIDDFNRCEIKMPKIGSGVDCVAYADKDSEYVVKYYSCLEKGTKTAELYRDMRNVNNDIFAKVYFTIKLPRGFIIVQERVNILADNYYSDLSDDAFDRFNINIIKLATRYYPNDLHEFNVGLNKDSELVVIDWGFFLNRDEHDNLEQAIHEFEKEVEYNEWWCNTMDERNICSHYYMEKLGQEYAIK